MQIRKKVALAAVMFGAIACGPQEKETPTGKKFAIVESGSGAAIKENNIVEFTLNIATTSDSTLFDITETGREYAAIPVFPDSVLQQQQAAGQPADPLGEMIRMMNEGDSASMKIIASDFFGKMAPPFIKDPSQEVVVGIRTVNVYADENAYREAMEKQQAEAMKKMEEEAEKYVAIDDQLIQDYLKENGIENAQKTDNGLYYVITEEGKGAKPEKGANITAHYTGTLLDGQKFDSSVDRGQPFNFPLGQGRVIAGWDEGFALFNKGTKATIFVPSGLGYGGRGAGSMIKPFSVLKFDVELIDFTNPSK